jgi:DNA polymerase III subunit beta
MKLTLERIDLVKALGLLASVVERRNTIPVLSNVLLRTEAGRLALAATDLDIELRVSIAADVSAPGEATLPAHTLHDIARKLPEGAQVSLDLPAGETRAVLRSGRSRFTLPWLPASDFPDIAASKATASFRIGAQILSAALSDVQFAISTEETRYYLNGIHLHLDEADDEPALVLVSTDGHRLARARVAPPPAITGGRPGIIIPRKAVGEMLRLLGSSGDEVDVSISPNRIRLETAAGVLSSKLIDGTFPDYKRVIPSANARCATVDAATLRAAVDRVSTISSERGRAVKLEFGSGKLALSVIDPDAGEAREEIECDYDAAPLTIGFNARYLADIIAALDTDTILLLLDSPSSPTILESAAGSSLLTVLMPMRV